VATPFLDEFVQFPLINAVLMYTFESLLLLQQLGLRLPEAMFWVGLLKLVLG
jgi:hypothetical protein